MATVEPADARPAEAPARWTATTREKEEAEVRREKFPEGRVSLKVTRREQAVDAAITEQFCQTRMVRNEGRREEESTKEPTEGRARRLTREQKRP